MNNQELINRERIKKLWIDVDTYNNVIQVAKRQGNEKILLEAIEAKLKTLEQIEKLLGAST